MIKPHIIKTVLAAVAVHGAVAIDTAPTVDLGYAVHKAAYNITGNYYSFNNIRFADPPTRFSKPQAPTTVNRTVNDGTVVRVCPNAYPWWMLEDLAPQYGLTASILETYLYSTIYDEDCLFLDVFVPRSVFENKGSGSGSAVLVWIYGGGFTIGSKDDSQYNPSGLILESQTEGQEGIIVVKISYRLGLFGWLAEGDGVTKNAGLHDQRLALDWVQSNVHLFGGDPGRVTVMGESAGGGSIIHHVTAYGGTQGPAPFRRAIPQSPGFEIALDGARGYDLALEAASNLTGQSVVTAAQLRSLDSKTLIEINKRVVNISSPGTFTYGPVVDGSYVPDLPALLLGRGKFDHDVEVMAGHNQHEAATFVSDISSDDDFRTTVAGGVFHGNVSAATIDHIATVVYPNDLSGVYGYTTQTQRLEALVNEEGFVCNTRYLGTAFGNQTYNYEFTYPPAYHQQDVGYTFFNGDPLDASPPGTFVWPLLAVDMQRRFTRFVQGGNPNSDLSAPQWPEYGDEATVLTFGLVTTTAKDDAANERCDYWQSGDWRR